MFITLGTQACRSKQDQRVGRYNITQRYSYLLVTRGQRHRQQDGSDQLRRRRDNRMRSDRQYKQDNRSYWLSRECSGLPIYRIT